MSGWILALAMLGAVWQGLPAGAGEDQSLAEGRLLLARLSADPLRDRQVFERIGYDRCIAMLSGLIAHGQRDGATREDWATMYRAAAALTTLYLARGEPLRAAATAGIEGHLYSLYDNDYPLAAAAARRALELKRGADPSSLYIEQAGLGAALLAAGEPAEAATVLRAARDAHPDPLSNHAALQWRGLIAAHLASQAVEQARSELEVFERRAMNAPREFRAHAALAAAEVAIASSRYDAALAKMAALREDLRREPSPTLDLELAASLAAVVLASARSMPVAEATAVAERIDREFRGLTVELSPFARAVVRGRRRAAGAFDAILQEDVAAVDEARRNGGEASHLDALRRLAATYASLNALTQAADTLEEAMRLVRQRRIDPGTGNVVDARLRLGVLLATADAYAATERLSDARGLYREVADGIAALVDAARRRALADLWGTAIIRSAGVEARAGQSSLARTALEAALAGRPEGAAFDRAEVLTTLADILGRPAPLEAADRYRAAVSLHERTRDRFSELTIRLRLAELLATSPGAGPHRLEEAARHLELARRDASTLQYADAIWRVEHVHGLVEEARGRPADAIAAQFAALEQLERLRVGLGAQERRVAFMDRDSAQRVTRRLIRLLLSAGRADDAWLIVQRAKARTFIEATAGQPRAAAPATPEMRQLEEEIAALRVTLAPDLQALVRGAARDPQAIARELRALELRYARLQAQAVGQAPKGAATGAPLSMADAQRRLPAGAALIEYAWLDDEIAAYVLTRDGRRHASWPVDPALREQVIQLRDLMSNLSASGDMLRLLTSVTSAVVAPVAALLPPDVDHLVIAPAGVMVYLPFEALLVAEGTPLVQRYAVSYLPSASLLPYLPAEPPKGPGRLFLGAIGRLEVEDWGALPGTLMETEAIAALVPGARRVSETALTREAVFDALAGADTVHLATHGILDDHAPIFSSLIVGTRTTRTRVSLYEIAQRRVSARLVVLSACETARGRVFRGDEVLGLTRTFLEAGSRTVVSSLWKVDDTGTSFIMQQFYGELVKGIPPARAMRTAMLAGWKEFGHPFYWAAFVVHGLH